MIKLVPVERVVHELDLPTRMYIESISRLANVSRSTARRYWYGKHEDGRPVLQIHLPTLQRIADAVGVDWRELLEEKSDDDDAS